MYNETYLTKSKSRKQVLCTASGFSIYLFIENPSFCNPFCTSG